MRKIGNCRSSLLNLEKDSLTQNWVGIVVSSNTIDFFPEIFPGKGDEIITLFYKQF